MPELRRVRDRDHVRYVADQSCLICGGRPSDAHHLRFAQNCALGCKVSDGFTVPLCRGHHREVHRCGDEPVWWLKVRINPMVTARALWRKTHSLPEGPAHSRVGATEPAASHDRSGQCEASRGPYTSKFHESPIGTAFYRSRLAARGRITTPPSHRLFRLNAISRVDCEPVLSAMLLAEADDALIIGDQRTSKLDRRRNQKSVRRTSVFKMVQLIAAGASLVTQRDSWGTSAGTVRHRLVQGAFKAVAQHDTPLCRRAL